jgi:hypothetical protein
MWFSDRGVRSAFPKPGFEYHLMQPEPANPTPVPAVPGEEFPANRGEISPSPFQVAPLVEQAQQAFSRDLPHLLRERPGQWVAYHGDRQIGFAEAQLKLYQECLRQGIDEEEFVVLCIEPEAGAMMLLGGQALA